MNPNRMAKAVLLVTALFFLAACSSSATKKAAVTATCDDFKKETTVAKEVEVTVGSTFQVTLCSQVMITGFKWGDSQIADPAVLEQSSHVIQTPTIRKSWDTPSTEVWIFKALQAGQTTVSFQSARSGEKQWEFSLTVAVK
ncbi:MAG: protease inhibitor I42 family protein [Anaerolineae bacterium]|nr:protease inhibitor I42 family protein [Anaerolineae bacterium]